MPRAHVAALAILLASVSLSAQQNHRPTDRERNRLLGPVKSVRTTATFQRGDGSVVRSGAYSEWSYNPDGSFAEFVQFDGQGSPISKTVFTSEGNGTGLPAESTIFRGPRAGRNVYMRDEHHRIAEIDLYNLDGSLRERKVHQFATDGSVMELDYDGSGQLISSTVRQHTQTVAPDGSEKMETSINGKVVTEVEQKRTPQGSESNAVSHTDRGLWRRTVVRDGSGTRTVQIDPNGHEFANATDPSGRTSTSVIVQPDGTEIRTVHRYDAAHRLIATEMYRRDVLENRNEITYENDAQGNWIKQVSRNESAAGNVVGISTEIRAITYY